MGHTTDEGTNPPSEERGELDSFLREAARSPPATPPGAEPPLAEAVVVGERLGRFEILGILGRGGMGVVYRAEDTALRRPVALKVLPADKIGDPERRRRFLREARAAAAVTHPNIATVYEAGEVGELLFIAMELCEGRSLRARCSEAIAAGDAGLPFAEVIRVGLDVSRALAKAHAARIVHRDIKPENLMLASEGQVKVLDFGIARFQPRDEVPTEVADTASAIATEEGRVLGTPGYMAPEQARGKAVDARADVFSLGVTLFELASGRRPFDGRGLDAVIAIDRDEAPRLGTVAKGTPQGLDSIIARCLAKKPADRYADGAALAVALEELQRVTASGTPHQLSAVSLTGSGTGPRRMPRGLWLVGAALVVLGVSIAALATTFSSRSGVATSSDASSSFAPGSNAAEAPASPSVITARPAPATSSKEAGAAYASALQLLRDGSLHEAIQNFQRAAELDPTMGAAHLRVILYADVSLCPLNEKRQHQASAARNRPALSELDRGLLAITELMIDENVNVIEVTKRAEALRTRFPQDAELAVLYGTILAGEQRFAEADAAFDRALELDPRFTHALVVKFVGQIQAGDLDGALRSVSRCLETSEPTSCLRSRARQYRSRGQCERYEVDARRLTALTPGNGPNRRFLAGALASRGASPQAVREALNADASIEASFIYEANLALLTGDLGSAEAAVKRYEAKLPRDTSERRRATVAKALMLIHEEKGDSRAALAVADAYADRFAGWVGDDLMLARPMVFYTRRRAGHVSDAELQSARQAWLTASNEWNPGERWIWFFAVATENANEAKEALIELPRYLPLPAFGPDDGLGLFSHAAVGKTYLLAGQVDEAIPWLRRAVASCTLFDAPIEMMRARRQLGEALEIKSDVPGACAAYKSVLDSWKQPKPRSVTQEKAASRYAALHCGH